MAHLPKNAVQASGTDVPADSIQPAGAATPSGLPLFRFGLRHLLFFVAGVSTLLAALASLHGVPALALLLAAMVVGLHVFGTAVGNQLRRHANPTQPRGTASPIRTAAAGPPAPDAHAHTPTLKPRSWPWYGRSGASFAWLPRLVVAAVLLGGCLGTLLLTTATGHRTSPAGLVVAVVSLAALSGWFAFLGGSFVGIVRGSLCDVVEQDASHARRSARK